MLKDLQKDLLKLATRQKAKTSAWFFKTGKGQYGFGDKFLGITVPEQRIIAKKYKNLPLIDIEKLLASEYHEERLVALHILVLQFQKADEKTRERIYRFYLKNTKHVNNWDLVDSSAAKIVGSYLLDKDRSILYKLAKSTNIWERRIAMVTTHMFIRNGEDEDTFKIADILLYDPHDLIQKSVGWMLREAGKVVSKKDLEIYLSSRYKKMPRTTLRYAIEHFPTSIRKGYLLGKI